MDWDKVIANLRAQTVYYTEQANKMSMHSGHYDTVKQMRMAADVSSILLSALNAGLAQTNGHGAPHDKA
jgi:hypothetical protein